QSRIYGAANPALTATFTGFVSGETSSVLGGTLALSTSAGTTSAVGTYPIQAGGLTSINYSITFTNGTLTVAAKALTITANNGSKTYGQTLSFSGTEFSPSGLVNSDTITSVSLVSSGAAAGAAVGPYSIVASAAVGTGLGNYTISYQAGTLTVNPRTLSITANADSKTYGQTRTYGAGST